MLQSVKRDEIKMTGIIMIMELNALYGTMIKKKKKAKFLENSWFKLELLRSRNRYLLIYFSIVVYAKRRKKK